MSVSCIIVLYSSSEHTLGATLPAFTCLSRKSISNASGLQFITSARFSIDPNVCWNVFSQVLIYSTCLCSIVTCLPLRVNRQTVRILQRKFGFISDFLLALQHGAAQLFGFFFLRTVQIDLPAQFIQRIKCAAVGRVWRVHLLYLRRKPGCAVGFRLHNVSCRCGALHILHGIVSLFQGILCHIPCRAFQPVEQRPANFRQCIHGNVPGNVLGCVPRNFTGGQGVVYRLPIGDCLLLGRIGAQIIRQRGQRVQRQISTCIGQHTPRRFAKAGLYNVLQYRDFLGSVIQLAAHLLRSVGVFCAIHKLIERVVLYRFARNGAANSRKRVLLGVLVQRRHKRRYSAAFNGLRVLAPRLLICPIRERFLGLFLHREAAHKACRRRLQILSQPVQGCFLVHPGKCLRLRVVVIQRQRSVLHLLVQIPGILAVLFHRLDFGARQLAARCGKLGAVARIRLQLFQGCGGVLLLALVVVALVLCSLRLCRTRGTSCGGVTAADNFSAPRHSAALGGLRGAPTAYTVLLGVALCGGRAGTGFFRFQILFLCALSLWFFALCLVFFRVLCLWLAARSAAACTCSTAKQRIHRCPCILAAGAAGAAAGFPAALPASAPATGRFGRCFGRCRRFFRCLFFGILLCLFLLLVQVVCLFELGLRKPHLAVQHIIVQAVFQAGPLHNVLQGVAVRVFQYRQGLVGRIQQRRAFCPRRLRFVLALVHRAGLGVFVPVQICVQQRIFPVAHFCHLSRPPIYKKWWGGFSFAAPFPHS